MDIQAFNRAKVTEMYYLLKALDRQDTLTLVGAVGKLPFEFENGTTEYIPTPKDQKDYGLIVFNKRKTEFEGIYVFSVEKSN